MTRWLEEFLLGLLVAAGRVALVRHRLNVHDEISYTTIGWQLQQHLDDIALGLSINKLQQAFIDFKVPLKVQPEHAAEWNDYDPDPTAPRQIPRSKRKADR